VVSRDLKSWPAKLARTLNILGCNLDDFGGLLQCYTANTGYWPQWVWSFSDWGPITVNPAIQSLGSSKTATFTSTNTGTNALLNVGLQGRARPVWEQTKMEVGWAIPSPDGHYLALWQASGDSNVWMIENF